MAKPNRNRYWVVIVFCIYEKIIMIIYNRKRLNVDFLKRPRKEVILSYTIQTNPPRKPNEKTSSTIKC